ncbi:MAG: terpene cyclase/mutase family protein [Acidobacteriota bacterium]|nr:terpene cyclase/mutase family protein [Acidobacteriota bacterium]
MSDSNFAQALDDLSTWCRKHDFAGYDPFDALNSRIFKATPLRNSAAARLLWTQTVKRSPLNLRGIALIRPEQNSKGIALFALAALANYRRKRTPEAEAEARKLLQQLISLRLTHGSGIAWGYNFDWQSRVFFAPRGTPTIVPTAFAARALVEAGDAFGDKSYLELARAACDFIVHELPRSVENDSEVCFSYAPETNTRIFNASLLAAETLALVSARDAASENCGLAVKAVRYVVNQQREDGSWFYGADPNQDWIDNFHTAYLLSSLKRIGDSCAPAEAEEFKAALQRGYAFWRKGFFLADGWAKYYHDTLYPVDTHAAAAAIVSLLDLTELDQDARSLAEQIATWSIRHLRDRRGFFYYQRRRFYTVHTPFMRWTQAWMTYALARLLETAEQSS